MGGGGVDWIDLAQDREQVAGSCVYGDEPSGCIKYGNLTEINLSLPYRGGSVNTALRNDFSFFENHAKHITT